MIVQITCAKVGNCQAPINKKPLCSTQRGFFIQGLKLTTLISGVPFDGFWAFDVLSWSASLDERPDDSIRGGGSTDGDAP